MSQQISETPKIFRKYRIETNAALSPFIDYKLFEEEKLLWHIKERFPMYLYPLILLKFTELRSLIPIEIEITEADSLKRLKYKIKKNSLGVYKITNNFLPNKEIVIPCFLYLQIPKIKIQNNIYTIQTEYNSKSLLKFLLSLLAFQNKYMVYKDQEPITIVSVTKDLNGKIETNIEVMSSEEQDAEISLMLSLVITFLHNRR